MTRQIQREDAGVDIGQVRAQHHFSRGILKMSKKTVFTSFVILDINIFCIYFLYFHIEIISFIEVCKMHLEVLREIFIFLYDAFKLFTLLLSLEN